MDAVSLMPMTPMPDATVVRPRQAGIAPTPYPTSASGLVGIGCGVGSSRWTNALAVNMKATKAFGHGPDRLLEHST